MRYLIILTLTFSLNLSYSQNLNYSKELKKLEQQLDSTSETNMKVLIYKRIIKLSFPDHLDEVRKYAKELLSISESLNKIKSKAFALYYIAEVLFENDDYSEAENYYKKALEIYEKAEDSTQLQLIYHKLGLSNQYLNHYDESLSYYQKSAQIAELLGDSKKEAINYQDIGTLYNDLQKYTLAENYYGKALKIYEETNNIERKAAIYQNIGVLHYNWGDFDKSIDYYKRSLGIYEKLNDKQNIAISLSNIGLVYEEAKDYNTALDYYLRALIIFEEMDFKPTLVYIFYNLGSLYRNLGNYTKSIEYFNKGLHLSNEISMTDYVSYNYEALSGVYEEMGKYEIALENYKEYVLIKDSLFNEEKHKQIHELEVEYQNVQKEKEIKFLKLDQELQEAKFKKKENQNLILIISSLLTILIALVLFLFARNQKKLTVKLQSEIEERTAMEENLREIKEELEEKVKERTEDIEKTNKKLISEIEEHKITMKNLESAKNKAEEGDRIKTNFLANISHEIRTPLNAISGFTQMLAFKDISDSKKNDYINMVEESCKSLTNLIDDIVDFAAIEAGEIKIEKKEFNPHPMLEYLQDHYTNELVKKNKENIILSYANENTETDLSIYSDSTRLKQILSLLLDNALKFTDKGYVEFGFTRPNYREIQFFVRDTGMGIEEKDFELIFERFRQVDESTTKKYDGTGIGLSVVKNLVNLLGGRIELESTKGKGSTFYINLPYKLKDEDIDEPSQPTEYNWKDKLILIAEDKQINFEIFKETLLPTNARVLWAKNGQEVIDLVKENEDIDLILLDIQMPVMDGYECAQILKSMKTNIPIIAQTAYALPQDSIKCFDAGCDDYIAKPISLDGFLRKLNKYLS